LSTFLIKYNMKRILFLTYRLPNSLLKDGYSIRALGLARALKRKYKIDLLSLHQKEAESKRKKRLEKIFDNIYLFLRNTLSESLGAIKGILSTGPIQEDIYFSLKMQGWINENYKNYNLIFCETLRTAKYVTNLNVPKIIDLIESLSLKYSRARDFVNPFWKLVYKTEIPRIQKREKEVFDSFDKVFISSPFDKRFLEGIIGYSLNNFLVLPNGVKEELLQNSTSNEEENLISFFGKMDYQPNEDAVLWFSKEIFPRIQNKISNLKFYIVGTNPTRKIRRLENENIKVTGCLKDPYKILRKSKLVVVPLRFGAGIQNKVLEAMALGKALITSPIGAQGIERAKPGEHFEVIKVDRPDAWMKKIMDLISINQKRSDLSKKAKILIKENYKWEKIGKQLLNEIDKTIS